MGVAATEDDLPLEIQQPNDDEPPQDEPQDPPQDGEPSDPPAGGDDEDGETVIQIGDEEPPASEEAKAAPQWVKELRERQRQLSRENEELRAKLNAGKPADAQAPKLPDKPKLSDPDIDFDEDKLSAAMDGWYAKKAEVEAFEAQQAKAVEEQHKRVQALNEHYANSIKALKVKDYQDAEDEAAAALSELQQGLIKAGAENPAQLVYALGKNPKELQALASIKDPVKFAVAVGKLETKVKVTKRTSTKPAPETTVRGNGTSGSSQATLERLEAEADRTGDRTKVIAYKRQQRQQAQK